MTEDMHDQAAHWHAAQDADDMDWDGFTSWLEADPRHRAAFEAVALLDDDITSQRVAIAQHLPPEGAFPSRRWGWAAGVGATVAAALALTIALPRAAPDTSWASGGSARTVALTDGSRATLAPHSRLTARAGDQTQLVLTGVAYFDVPHRTDRALAISAGGYVVSDIGTRFEIATDRDATRVAVAEGSLSVTAADLAQPERLTAGRMLTAIGQRVTLSTTTPEDVASWRRGDLVYADAPLRLVAADLARYGGREVAVDPAIADRRFSGALTIGDGTKLADTVAAIAGVTARDNGGRVRLEPRR